MSLFTLAIGGVFLLGYAAITLERKWHLNKALTAAALGAAIWVMIAIGILNGDLKPHETLQSALEVAGAEIFGLIAFLLAAMTIVEILVHYRLFDLVRVKLLKFKLNEKSQLWVVGIIAFFLSAVIDNLTCTIVMVQIGRRFFRGQNLLIAASVIVIAANAGGAWSPIGDVTTIMLWLAGKFSAAEVIKWVFLPSLALFFVSSFMLIRKIKEDSIDIPEEDVKITFSEKTVIVASLSCFFMPFVFTKIGLPPYMGLLAGLGFVGILITFFRHANKHETHLDSDIAKMLSKVDFASLVFFIGILLAVSGLEHVGILHWLSEGLNRIAGNLFSDPALGLLFVNSTLGALSAIVDNIPITAASVSIIISNDPAIWSLLALTVGTGGSMLVIGSAPGVVAMGMVKDLAFFKYVKIATIPAAVGYITAIIVWWVEYKYLF